MRSYGPEKIHNIGLFGHGGSGKTTLTEALLLTAKAISRAGRVEDGNSVSDYDPDEQKRRMSINLSVAPVEWKDDKINLIDVPGYADFAGEVASAMRVIDGAVIVLDAAGGVEVGTEMTWEAAKAANVPRILFINKLDRENANFFRTVEQAQQLLDDAVIPMQIPIGSQREFKGIISLRRQRAWMIADKHDGSFVEAEIPADMVGLEQEWREKLIDKIAATNDDLIEKYLEGGADALSPDDIQRGLRAGIANGSIVPVFCGAADQAHGTAQLLDGILDSFPSAARKTATATDLLSGKPAVLKPAVSEPFSALVFKTLVDPYGKISFVRVFSGELHANSSLFNPRTRKDERIGQVYMIRGKEQISVPALGPGDIGVVTKLVDVATNDTLCSHDRPLQLVPITFPAPSYWAMVKPKTRADLDRLGGALHNVVEEDPTLQVSRDAQSGDTVIAGLGEPHLQIIAERMKRKFNVDVELELPRVAYRETIRGKAEAQYRHKKQTGGAGQFGDVTIRIEPLEPNPEREDPLEFVNAIVGGVIDRTFVPAVEKGVRDAMAEGVVSGNHMVDVRVTLFDGKMHPVDSKEIAFKIAGHEAFKLAAHKANPVIMEPIYALEIVVPDQFSGDIMSDMTTRRGRVLGMLPDGSGRTTINATAPLAEIQRYATDLRSLTQGRGRFSMQFDHFEDVPTHLAQSLIEAQKARQSEGGH
ncbi:MAG TPA: elongation factor G [Kouleothrix sp.]|uniref:elongation factor G n=1 Tax=Kouleothrix sp. TaxID=2779161 RepID=UPI002BB47435|nr:elongation factor G [Kouleothrix sp.]HRC76069.1 elongation factor G [Kouleothrix sp.]